MLVKLTLGVNFINILHTKNLYERCFASFFLHTYVRTYVRKKFCRKDDVRMKNSYEKFVRKMLVKLTTGEVRLKVSGRY